MARRRARNEFDDLADALNTAPFWLGPIFAAATFVLIRYGGEWALTHINDPHGLNKIFAPTFFKLIGGFIAFAIFAI